MRGLRRISSRAEHALIPRSESMMGFPRNIRHKHVLGILKYTNSARNPSELIWRGKERSWTSSTRCSGRLSGSTTSVSAEPTGCGTSCLRKNGRYNQGFSETNKRWIALFASQGDQNFQRAGSSLGFLSARRGANCFFVGRARFLVGRAKQFVADLAQALETCATDPLRTIRTAPRFRCQQGASSSCF